MRPSDVYAARLGRRGKETNMNGKSTGLYLVGGIAGLLSGILMIVSGYLVMFHLKETFIGSAEQQLGFIAHHPLSGIVHGLSVVSLILIVPMIVALLALLGTTAPIRGFLGIGFAALWVFVEIVGHLSQTAPLRALGELYTNPSANEMALSIYQVSQEFWEALSMTAAFFCVLMCLCSGSALVAKPTRSSGYALLIAAIAFPIGLLFPSVGIQLHVAVRGLAFILLSGALIQISRIKEG